jgi:hypothetical protein
LNEECGGFGRRFVFAKDLDSRLPFTYTVYT